MSVAFFGTRGDKTDLLSQVCFIAFLRFVKMVLSHLLYDVNALSRIPVSLVGGHCTGSLLNYLSFLKVEHVMPMSPGKGEIEGCRATCPINVVVLGVHHRSDERIPL